MHDWFGDAGALHAPRLAERKSGVLFSYPDGLGV